MLRNELSANLTGLLSSVVGFSKWALLRLARKIVGTDARIIADYLSRYDVPKLHIGCGPHVLAGWLNSDLNLKSRTVLYLNAIWPFPFNDHVFDYVFSEHMIEHVAYEQGHHMLSECYRVMKPNGKIRITTPNLAFLIDLYQDEKSELQNEGIRWFTDSFLENISVYKDTYLINGYFRLGGHQFIYDEWTLRKCLEEAGFINVIRCNVGESEHVELHGLENEVRAPAGYLRLESLVLEGSKPGQDVRR